MDEAAVDNDILWKGSWYGLLRELIAAIPSKPSETLILGQARFVIGKKLQKANAKGDLGAAEAIVLFNEVLQECVEIEPTGEELSLAAAFEAAAQAAQIGGLHEGESQLCAVTIIRVLSRVATGDKTAIRAVEQLAHVHEELRKLQGRLICLEQLISRLLTDGDPNHVSVAVRRHPKADKALANCFRSLNPREWSEGLASEIRYLRQGAPTMLEP